MNIISDPKPDAQKFKLSSWLLIISTVYAVAGHFLGNELSLVLGFVSTPLCLLIGFLIGRKYALSSTTLKAAILSAPLLLLVFVVSYKNSNTRVASRKELNGSWVATTSKAKFTLTVKDTTGLFSVEPGPKNVSYRVHLNSDSLILTAEGGNRLACQVAMLSDGTLVLNAGGGLFFNQSK